MGSVSFAVAWLLTVLRRDEDQNSALFLYQSLEVIGKYHSITTQYCSRDSVTEQLCPQRVVECNDLHML